MASADSDASTDFDVEVASARIAMVGTVARAAPFGGIQQFTMHRSSLAGLNSDQEYGILTNLGFAAGFGEPALVLVHLDQKRTLVVCFSVLPTP